MNKDVQKFHSDGTPAGTLLANSMATDMAEQPRGFLDDRLNKLREFRMGHDEIPPLPAPELLAHKKEIYLAAGLSQGLITPEEANTATFELNIRTFPNANGYYGLKCRGLWWQGVCSQLKMLVCFLEASSISSNKNRLLKLCNELIDYIGGLTFGAGSLRTAAEINFANTMLDNIIQSITLSLSSPEETVETSVTEVASRVQQVRDDAQRISDKA